MILYHSIFQHLLLIAWLMSHELVISFLTEFTMDNKVFSIVVVAMIFTFIVTLSLIHYYYNSTPAAHNVLVRMER